MSVLCRPRSAGGPGLESGQGQEADVEGRKATTIVEKSLDMAGTGPKGATNDRVGLDDEKVENRLFVKGAAEVVAQRCNRLKLENGRVIPITSVIRAQLDQKVGR